MPVIDSKDDFESFDFDGFAMDTKAEVGTVATEIPVIDSKDDFESFDFNLAAQNIGEKESSELGVTNDAIDFDFDMSAIELDKQSSNFGSPDLTEMDELETKLDLARAYIDMGDAQAARNITEEVLRKGTVEQKKLAEAILDFLK
jgi:pilus assembly protein FimV